MQRVAVARALCKEAKLVLFDEIFVNLDYKLREQMRIEFKELMDRVKITSVFSTPDPEDAFMLADRVAVIRDGKIEQYDSKDVVYNNPVDEFTGAYFGHPEMNLLECVRRAAGRWLRPRLERPADAHPSRSGSAASSRRGATPSVSGRSTCKIHAEGASNGAVDGLSQKSMRAGKILLTEVVGLGHHRARGDRVGGHRGVHPRHLSRGRGHGACS